MFNCVACNKTVGPYVKPVSVVLKTRNREYLPRPLMNDPGGYGTEIVKEVNVCPPCVNDAKKG